MEKDRDLLTETIKQALISAPEALPPASLLGQVLFAIEKKQRLYNAITFWVYAAAAACSLLGCIIVLRLEWSTILHSEATQLLSLLFSDFNVMSAYWREYSLSLLESIPIVSIIFVCAFIWAAGASLWMTWRTYTKFFHGAIKHV